MNENEINPIDHLENAVNARVNEKANTLTLTIVIDLEEFQAKSKEELHYVTGFTAYAMEILKGTAIVLARKNYMYGNSSIAMTGQIGIAVRSFDKVSRLLNIYKNNVDASNTDEKAFDSWQDLQGYSLIGLANSIGLWDYITNHSSEKGEEISNAYVRDYTVRPVGIEVAKQDEERRTPLITARIPIVTAQELNERARRGLTSSGQVQVPIMKRLPGESQEDWNRRSGPGTMVEKQPGMAEHLAVNKSFREQEGEQ